MSATLRLLAACSLIPVVGAAAHRSGSFPASFAGVTVTLNGIASPLMYISSQQINLRAPFLAGLGVTVPAPATGSVNPSPGTPLNLPITFGNGLAAAVVSAVALPGSISGVWQVDVRMPGDTGGMRKVHEMRTRGITILFVSHAVADVKAIGDRALWLDHGRVVEIGDPDRVVARYLAAMVEKDSTYLQIKAGTEVKRQSAGPVRAPEVVETIPNVDHRYGDGRAEVLGIAVLDEQGRPLHMLDPGSSILVRISVRAKEEVPMPMVGFMLRNQLGMDFSGTNTAREGHELAPMQPGDIYTVDFYLDLPELYPASFSFSPAIADGTLLGYRMCDWIDNAVVLQMGRSEAQIYGYIHLPCRVEVNSRVKREPLLEKRIG